MSNIGELNILLLDVVVVQQNCEMTKLKKDACQLDDFQQSKAELNNLLKTIKDDVKTRKGLEERTGESKEGIEMKYQIESEFKKAQDLHDKMNQAYENDVKKFEKQKSGALTQPDLDERKEILSLFKQDLEFTECEFKPKKSKGGGFQIAQNAQTRWQKQREEGMLSPEPIPLTENQQAFIQESIERDQLLGQKLDVMLHDVHQLGEVAKDINEELGLQDVMLDEIENKMDKVEDKLETRNEQMKKLLKASGGAQRWCPILILIVIFLALCGYIYSVV